MTMMQYYSHTVPQYHSTTVHSTVPTSAIQYHSTTVPQYTVQYQYVLHVLHVHTCQYCIHVHTCIQHVTSCDMYTYAYMSRTRTHARARARGTTCHTVLCTEVLWYCGTVALYGCVAYCVLWYCGTVVLCDCVTV